MAFIKDRLYPKIGKLLRTTRFNRLLVSSPNTGLYDAFTSNFESYDKKDFSIELIDRSSPKTNSYLLTVRNINWNGNKFKVVRVEFSNDEISSTDPYYFYSIDE